LSPQANVANPAGSSLLLGLRAPATGELPSLSDNVRLPALAPAARTGGNPPLAGAKTGPAEQTGTGPLFPALIVGVGHMGLYMLQRLRRAIVDQFGTRSLPHLRFCYIDTDPDSIQGIESGAVTSPDANEIYLA